MSALIRTPLSAPGQLVGTVDATRDRARPTARTVEQAFGPAARGCRILPMDADPPMHRADRIVTVASCVAGALVVLLLVAERLGLL